MSSIGRGVGLSPRPGRGDRGTPRPQPSSNRWISVSTTSPSMRKVESLDGPVPDTREIVERQFTTYCAVHLGHPRNAAHKKI